MADNHTFWKKCEDWLIAYLYRGIEAATVLMIFGVCTYAVFWIVFGNDGSDTYKRMMGLLPLISDNWKAVLILAILLYFRTVRTFLEEVQEGWGMKRGKKSNPTDQNSNVVNPPASGGGL